MEPRHTIDYDAAARSYDNTRLASDGLVDMFQKTVGFSPTTVVLDFGCGTGNYLDLIWRSFGSRCYGVEPAAGMRDKARSKNSNLVIEDGDHERIPFKENSFDFCFMTDVIHHVPSMETMFLSLKRVLKRHQTLCVVTESHAQVTARFYNRYFPSLADNERHRYPDIPAIRGAAERAGLAFVRTGIRWISPTASVTPSLIRTAEEKNFSMFRLLGEREYTVGLERMRRDLGAVFDNSEAGETLIWFEKR